MNGSAKCILAIVNDRLSALNGEDRQVRSTQVLALIEVLGEMLERAGTQAEIVEGEPH